MEANVVTRKATILKMVKGARLEIVIRNKKISASDEELVQKVMDKFQKEDDDFATESKRLCHWDSVIRDIVWLEANREESKMIIDRLKSGDESFANDFFYDDDRTGCNISRIRSKILSFIKQTYKVDVSSDEFGNILYAFLWNGGTWSVLDSYSCKSSFFCWLEEIARHELIRYLKDMNIIKVKSERTAGNTRMLGMSVLPETWECVLADTMPDGFHKKLLSDILVKRKTKEAMEVEYGVDAEDLHRLQKRAEADFKDRLIRSNRVIACMKILYCATSVFAVKRCRRILSRISMCGRKITAMLIRWQTYWELAWTMRSCTKRLRTFFTLSPRC